VLRNLYSALVMLVVFTLTTNPPVPTAVRMPLSGVYEPEAEEP
jgi:hypothetical protein